MCPTCSEQRKRKSVPRPRPRRQEQVHPAFDGGYARNKASAPGTRQISCYENLLGEYAKSHVSTRVIVAVRLIRGMDRFRALVERATSPDLPAGHEDIAFNLDVCDNMRSRQVLPHQAMTVLRSRLENDNPVVQLLALGVRTS